MKETRCEQRKILKNIMTNVLLRPPSSSSSKRSDSFVSGLTGSEEQSPEAECLYQILIFAASGAKTRTSSAYRVLDQVRSSAVWVG